VPAGHEEENMIQVYLYGSDGRVLFLVAVSIPMPQLVFYGGIYFAWSSLTDRYQEVVPGLPVASKAGEHPAAGPEHKPPAF
jgi:hypothetical protein